MRIVQKYGGTSLADGEKIRLAAMRAVNQARMGKELVIVVSAQGDTTDILIDKAKQINPHRAAREMDAFLSAGEQLSAALLAMAIGALGHPAISLTGWQAGIHTDGIHGNAKITHICTDRIEEELAAGKIVVVAGFQGMDLQGDITTLGRGGSDTTAVALAAWLKADMCQIFTDVDGVYDRDPRQFPDAKRYPCIGYDAMLALVENGAQVLHDRCVELARDKKIRLEVLSAATGAPGTIVGDLKSL
ncbi:MAG: aspartate kinase [Oscillospiraceae bacterium]|nr:aspartate kinase [Oscillospiraceae bacterium]